MDAKIDIVLPIGLAIPGRESDLPREAGPVADAVSDRVASQCSPRKSSAQI